MIAKTGRVMRFVLVGVLFMAFIGACHPKRSKTVIIDSVPQGATISIDGEILGETPKKVDLDFPNPKQDRHIIKLNKTGYSPEERYHYYRDSQHIMFLLEKIDK